jgi:nucleotide-binding universal stress UspA family protein
MAGEQRPTHIVVGVDGSRQALAAAEYGASLAAGFGAQLTLLHVAVPLPRSSFDLAPDTALRAETAARLNGEHYLREAQSRAGPGTAPVTELQFGDPAEVICRRAGELGADLVVIGSRGLGLLDRLLLGSVSSAVIQRAPCSVLVVRDRQQEGAAENASRAFSASSDQAAKRPSQRRSQPAK